VLLPTFDPIKYQEKKMKIQNTKGYTKRKPRRLSKLVVKDQNDKWKSWRIKMYKIDKIDKIDDSILIDKGVH